MVELHDESGPAATDPALSLIVLSPETARALETVNGKRAAAGLKPLESFLIEFVEGYGHVFLRLFVELMTVCSAGQRLSSTWLRERDSKRQEK